LAKPVVLLKRAIFAVALIPLARLVAGAFTGDLTANPIDYITDQTGSTALTCLVSSLAVTPIRRLTGWHQIIQLRRMLGLFAFFYACLHFLTWFVLDWFFDVRSMGRDILSRPFITMGMTTFLLLIPLAITSTNAMMRRLGRRWQLLHRLAYVAGVTAMVHFWWVRSAKADIVEPRRWIIVLAILFGIRVWWAFRTRRPARS
jgi:sulfoxide reductase heme-binding subunit YedZ